MRKILISIITVLLVFVLVPSAAFAAGQKIYDNAELFTLDETAQLQETVDAYVLAFDSDLIIVTITDDQGKTSQVYADDFYDQNGFGKDGVLFLINMDSRELYISTSGKMIDILNDARINDLLDLQYEYVSDQDYFGAMQRSIKKMEDYIDAGPVSGKSGQPASTYSQDGKPESELAAGVHEQPVSASENYRPPVSSRTLTADWIVISILIGAGIGGLVVLIIYKQYKKEYKPVPYDYRKEAKLVLNSRMDNLIDTHTTSRYIPPPDSGSAGSSTHSSSSGNTHGGGGRRF
jgi:uncharacterized protein